MKIADISVGDVLLRKRGVGVDDTLVLVAVWRCTEGSKNFVGFSENCMTNTIQLPRCVMNQGGSRQVVVTWHRRRC